MQRADGPRTGYEAESGSEVSSDSAAAVGSWSSTVFRSSFRWRFSSRFFSFFSSRWRFSML